MTVLITSFDFFFPDRLSTIVAFRDLSSASSGCDAGRPVMRKNGAFLPDGPSWSGCWMIAN